MAKKVKAFTKRIKWLGSWAWREEINSFVRPYLALVSNGKREEEITLYAYREAK